MEFSSPPLQTKKGIADKIESPQKTFFFERSDGSIFFTNEQEAWIIYSGKSQMVGIRPSIPKLIGTSDGKITNQATLEARAIFHSDGLEKAQEHIRKAQELELETARKTIIPPRNFDTIGNKGEPINISELR